MKLTVSDAAVSVLQPQLGDQPTNILLSYDDGVGPYSHHGLVALQIAFKLIFITANMPMNDYGLKIDSNIGPIYAKKYSSEFFGPHLKIDFNARYHLLTLVDDGEIIEPNLEIQDLRM